MAASEDCVVNGWERRRSCVRSLHEGHPYYAPAPRVGALSDDARLTSV